ncbi:hypothetical protein L3X38_037911 [Prunus dulcis]|uniref:Uncharacterized protein n=1 Tax=Prunus dulcis TaxID=3755 RepID=A0AAD4YRP0_PRUDU|nr:hypothetical protein L3X38_037911 [Prunus dulcis]
MVFGFAPALMFTVREQNKAVDALVAKSYDFPLGLHVLDMEPFFLNNVPAADATVSLIQGLDILDFGAVCSIGVLACKEGVTTGLVDI